MKISVSDPSSVMDQLPRAAPLTFDGALGKLALGAGVFLAIFFLVGELFLRVVYWEGESFSAHRGPMVQRLERDFKFNRFDGPSRGPEPFGPKHPEGTRILIQGDSITWGQGVRYEEQLFSSRLLTRLREIDRHVDMAVLARPGREIDEHLQQLKKWGHELQPDVIIYQWYINDIELDKKQRPRTGRIWRHPYFLYAMLAKSSYLFFFLDFSLDTVLPSSILSYESHLSSQFKEGSDGWQLFVQYFSDWAMSAKELTPHVVVALYPHMSLQQGVAPSMLPEVVDIQTRVLTLCRANNLLCVDLSTSLTKFEDSGSIKVSPFDDHPSPEVHGVIAEALYELFRGGTVKLQSSSHREGVEGRRTTSGERIH
jgi:lysophospholipase L1-like esterase